MVKHCIVSLDIGKHNTGYAVVRYDDKCETFAGLDLEFGVYDLDGRGSKDIVLRRCEQVRQCIEMLVADNIVDMVIVEKQVNTNTIAMGIMYAVVSTAKVYTDNVVLYDPKHKFIDIRERYVTKNKQHKRQSIEYARTLLTNTFPHTVNRFNATPKKDDISDAINQMFTHLVAHNTLNVTIDEYRLMLGLSN